MVSQGGAAVKMFGSLVVADNDGHLARFPTVRCTEMLGYLFLSPGVYVSRTRLIEEIWPEVTMDSGRNRLSVSIHACKKAFTNANLDFATYVLLDGQQMCAVLAGVRNEWTEFWSAYHQAKGIEDLDQKESAFQKLIELYRSPVLVDIKKPWADQARAESAAAYREASLFLAELHEQRGNPLEGRLLRERADREYGNH